MAHISNVQKGQLFSVKYISDDSDKPATVVLCAKSKSELDEKYSILACAVITSSGTLEQLISFDGFEHESKSGLSKTDLIRECNLLCSFSTVNTEVETIEDTEIQKLKPWLNAMKDLGLTGERIKLRWCRFIKKSGLAVSYDRSVHQGLDEMQHSFVIELDEQHRRIAEAALADSAG